VLQQSGALLVLLGIEPGPPAVAIASIQVSGRPAGHDFESLQAGGVERLSHDSLL